MKYVVIAGSHRAGSQTGRIARYVEQAIVRTCTEAHVFLLDLGVTQLPLWDESMWKKESTWPSTWGPVSTELHAADAIVVLTPEWGGMATPAVKNFFLLCSKHELAHKPALLMSVSAGRGGVYPISELRASSYKNTQVCYMPEHIIVRDAEKMLVGTTPAGEDDTYLRARIDYALQLLTAYAKALRTVRDSGVLDTKTYPFGM